jgi:hypothetical protein
MSDYIGLSEEDEDNMLQRTPEENILQSRQRRRIKLYQEQSELLLIVSVLWMLLSLLDEMRPMLSADMTQQLKLPIVSICAFAELVRLLLNDAKSDWPSTPRFLCRLISILLDIQYVQLVPLNSSARQQSCMVVRASSAAHECLGMQCLRRGTISAQSATPKGVPQRSFHNRFAHSG